MLTRLIRGIGCLFVVSIGLCMIVATIGQYTPSAPTSASSEQSLMVANSSNTSAPKSTTSPTSTTTPITSPSAASTDEPDEEESDDPNYNAVMARFKRVRGMISVDSLNVEMTNPGAFYVYAELVVQFGYNTEKMATTMRSEATKALGKTPVDCTIIIFDGKVAKDYSWSGNSLNITTLSITPVPKVATKVDLATTATKKVIVTQIPSTKLPTKIVFNEAEYVRLLTDGLFITAGGRHIETVRVIDGRAKGGERTIIVSYLTTETTEVGYVDEWLDIFGGIAATIRAHNLDVDSISLVAGTATGKAAGILVVSKSDLLAWHQGDLSRGQFLQRIKTTSF